VKFLTPPEIGFRFVNASRDAECIGHRDHTKRDGSTVRLFDWATTCAACGVKMYATSTLDFERAPKRCKSCINKKRPTTAMLKRDDGTAHTPERSQRGGRNSAIRGVRQAGNYNRPDANLRSF
jgi:hypothetical protein